MDFLDPEKMRRHSQLLFLGYGLIAIAIVATALILLYQSSGYGVNRQGEVIQNGIVFTATTPSGAELYLDGQDTGNTTNRRLVLVAGQYVFQYRKTGYYDWTHSLDVQGSSVNRLDYAFLFPKKLDTTKMAAYEQAPLLTSQSPDKRWLVVMLGDGTRNVEVFDLKNLAKQPLIATLPATVSGATSSNWQLVEWSTDNKHLLVSRTVGGATDFVLLDREDPTQSVDLNKTLAVNPSDIRLHDKKYDQYYLYDAAAKTLQTASLSQPQPLAYLQHVLAFKPYGSDKMLYVTDDVKQDSPTDTRVAAMLADGDHSYTIRKMPTGSRYLLEMAGYNGKTYIAAGVDTENKVLLYRNPVDQINDKTLGVAVPVTALPVPAPDFLAFSDNAQYLMVENGQNFAVYDAELSQTYHYKLSDVMDNPATHAIWMDGDRLTYPSGGKLLVFDADQTNRRKLMPTTAGFLPAFAPDYKRVINIAPVAPSGGYQVQYTWLRTTADR